MPIYVCSLHLTFLFITHQRSCQLTPKLVFSYLMLCKRSEHGKAFPLLVNFKNWQLFKQSLWKSNSKTYLNSKTDASHPFWLSFFFETKAAMVSVKKYIMYVPDPRFILRVSTSMYLHTCTCHYLLYVFYIFYLQ